MMELPNYFLADLPDASTLTPKLIAEACATLKENRAKFLADRATDDVIAILDRLAREWLDPEFPIRQLALEQGPEMTGFSRETLVRGLDQLFAQVTRENLEALVRQDFGSLRRLDEIVSDEFESSQDRGSIARGSDLLVHITGGLLPNPPIHSIILGLLARSAQFVKCASGTAFLPRMFAHSLYAVQPKLAACLEIAEWKGGTEPLDAALFQEANLVTATGSDETLTAIRRQLRGQLRLIGHGHKLSLAIVTQEALAKISLKKTLAAAAEDITAWDQLGCLSPHVIYVEAGGPVTPMAFAQGLADELAAREESQPRGRIPPEAAAAISTRRMFYQVRAGSDQNTRLWSSSDSTAWTVVYESDLAFQPSCLNRFIFVKPVANMAEATAALGPLEGRVSTVGLAAPPPRAREIALQLARAGVTRVCKLGQMQNPPLTWRHDGRPSLGDLATWTDFEF